MDLEDEIEELDIEQLKAQFSTLMSTVVEYYGDDKEASDKTEKDTANAAE